MAHTSQTGGASTGSFAEPGPLQDGPVLAERGVRGLGWRAIGVAAVVMLVGTLALHVVCLSLCPKPDLDPWSNSDFYPLSVFKFRLPHADQLGLGVLVAGAFHLLWQRHGSRRLELWEAFGMGLGLVFASNMLHGWRFGIDYPTATWGTGGIEYYNDAILLKGPRWFLQRFNAIQFELLEHARTHPPGPVLLYYVLHHALGNPGLISIAVGALSLGLTLPYLRRLFVLVLGAEPPGALLLYAILPALLVYGIAVVDACIAALFLATLVEFLDESRPRGLASAALFLALSACFTFAALFLLPVLVGFDVLRRRRLTRSLLVIAGAAAVLALLEPLTGFDWWRSFLKASASQNEGGFLLWVNPRHYLWYRVGAVAEILIFFTPFLCVLGWWGRRRLVSEHADAAALAWLGPASLGAMLLAGALPVGEAARVGLFILPYLILPASRAFGALDHASRQRCAQAVFGWGLLLQLFGFYHW